MAPVAIYTQADQIQVLELFHGYPLDFFTAVKRLPDHFYKPLSRITKPLDH